MSAASARASTWICDFIGYSHLPPEMQRLAAHAVSISRDLRMDGVAHVAVLLSQGAELFSAFMNLPVRFMA